MYRIYSSLAYDCMQCIYRPTSHPPPDPKPERISAFVKYFEYTISVRVKLFQLTFKKKCLNPKNSCTLYKPLGKRRTISPPPPPPPPPLI